METNSEYKIAELYIYPIKSLGGIAVKQAEVYSTGFKYDRRYMLIDSNNHFISQREHIPLCLLNISITENGFAINHKIKDVKPLHIPFEMNEGEEIEVIIWEDKVKVIVAHHQYNLWFQSVTGLDCRLVYMPDNCKRYVDINYAKDNEIVSFADGYPILIIGEESLKLLNSKLIEPLPVNRFRPNVVFTGGTSHDEDNWREFEINKIIFYGVKRCARCVITTINQTNASRNAEPLKTLATYRNINNKILFGMNVLSSTLGQIQIGNTINICG